MMAGTAAGAAKATAARKARAAERRALLGQSKEQPSSTLPATVVTDGTVSEPFATVDVSAQAVGPLVPASVVVAGDIIRGKIKASAAVRGNLALRVLELASKPPAGRMPQSPALAGALEALARALGARVPRTVEGAASVEVVTPEQS
jgi:hypothetical protein